MGMIGKKWPDWSNRPTGMLVVLWVVIMVMIFFGIWRNL